MRDVIEELLREYYKKKWKLNHINSQIAKLNEDIKIIKQRIAEGINIIKLPGVAQGVPTIVANRYSEGLEKSMAELEETLAKLKTELGEKVHKRNSLEIKKRTLEEAIAETGVEHILETMEEIEIKILEQKYIYRRNFTRAGTHLNMSEGAVRYWYQKAMERFEVLETA